MKYYEGHESVYRKIEKEGKSSWGEGQSVNGLDFEESKKIDLLNELFSRYSLPASSYAMDLGCGTGPVSHYLSQKGFRTYGIDVSPTAIEIAQKLAAERGLDNVTFEVKDIVNYPNPKPTFDLVVDASCLHCIVFDEDRHKVLSNIKDRSCITNQ